MSAFDLRNAMFLDGSIIGIGGLRGNAPNPAGAPGPNPSGPISTDGHQSWGVSNSATQTSSNLVTTKTNGLLVAAWAGLHGSGSGVISVSTVTSTSGLTWSRLGGIASPLKSNSNHINLEVWTAFAPSALTAEQISFNLTSSCPCNSCGVVALQGIVGSNGLYALDGLVQTAAAADSGIPTVSMTTTYTNDIIIYVAAGRVVGSNIVPPTGFTLDATAHDSTALLADTIAESHRIYSTVQTGLSLFPPTSGGLGVCVGFALKGS